VTGSVGSNGRIIDHCYWQNEGGGFDSPPLYHYLCYPAVTRKSRLNLVPTDEPLVAPQSRLEHLREGLTVDRPLVHLRPGSSVQLNAFGRVKPRDDEIAASPSWDNSGRQINGSERQLNRSEVTWSSRDTRIATVDSKGVVTALRPGVALIFVQCSDICVTTWANLEPRPGDGWHYLSPHRPTAIAFIIVEELHGNQ
jgi:Bacterial Ig-like domain (group 2)